MNNKGYSASMTWVYSLVSLFGIGVLYIVFSQVFDAYLVPIIKNQVLASTMIPGATQTLVNANIDRYMTYFHFLPVILFFVVVFYMLVSAFRKETQETF